MAQHTITIEDNSIGTKLTTDEIGIVFRIGMKLHPGHSKAKCYTGIHTLQYDLHIETEEIEATVASELNPMAIVIVDKRKQA